MNAKRKKGTKKTKCAEQSAKKNQFMILSATMAFNSPSGTSCTFQSSYYEYLFHGNLKRCSNKNETENEKKNQEKIASKMQAKWKRMCMPVA